MADDAGAVTETPVESFASSYEASAAEAANTEGGNEGQQDLGANQDDATNKDSSKADQDKDADQGQDDTKSDDISGKSPKADEADADKSKDTDKEGDDKDKGEGEEGKEEDANEAQSYDKFVIPEGMEVNQEALDEVSAILAKHKLPQEDAQKVVDIGADMISKFAKDASEHHQKIVKGWEKDTLEQFGKDGDAAFEERSATAQLAIEKFFPAEQRQYITSWGIGNMSGFFAMAEVVGKAMKEDGSFASGAGNSNKEETVADIWYPNSNA